MKHTPGPWKVAEHYGAFRVITASRPVALVLYDGGSEDREVMPNARLIAAAPELLAACKALVDNLIWASGSSDFAPDGIAREGWLKVEPSISQGMAAIAKAEGEA